MAWEFIGANTLSSATAGNLAITADLTSFGKNYADIAWHAGFGLAVAVGTAGLIDTTPDGVAWAPRASGISTNLTAVGGSASLAVAVGAGGVILTSPDADAWTARTSGTANNLLDAAWSSADDVFVAVGNSGTILTSSDGGVTWVPRTSGTTNALTGVAYSDALDLFVAVGVGGTILTSSDGGVTWVPSTSGTANTLNDVVWAAADAQFVTVGNGGTILTSPTAVTWTARTSGTANALLNVAYSPPLDGYAVVGLGSKILTSGDAGVTWTTQASPAAFTDSISGVAWATDRFLAVSTVGSHYSAAALSAWVLNNQPAAGDLLIVGIAYRDSAPFTLPADWSLVAPQQSGGNISNDPSIAVASGLLAYCVHSGSMPDATFIRTGGGIAVGRMLVYRGGTATPLEGGSANTLAATSVTVTTGAITTATDGALVILMGALTGTNNASAYTAATDPVTGWTERQDGGASGGGIWAVLAMAQAIQSVAGSTGTLQYTAAGASHHVAIAAAFAPAGSGPEDAYYPISFEITDPAEDAYYPIRFDVLPAQDAYYPISFTILDPAVLAGLDGAGGWAPAPDGRWQEVVVLDGADISSRLIGAVTVRQADNQASTAEFSFVPTEAIAPMGLIRRRVRISFAARGPAGEVLNAQTMFTGVVERPRPNADTGVISCLCTDQLQEVMVSTPRAWIDANVGGRWHVAVSGEAADNWRYALDRLSSVPKSIALDALGRPQVLPWRGPLPKSVTIQEADFFDGSSAGALKLDLPSGSELCTRVELRMQYRYATLRNRSVVTQWAKDAAWFIFGPDHVGGPLQWLTTDMIEGAIGGLSGWEVVGDIKIEHPLPGVYPLGPGIDDGGYIIDPAAAQDLAIGWRAYLRHRWQQTRTEDYKITLVAPNLESLVGRPVPEQMGASLEGPEPDRAWEADRNVEPRFAAAGSPSGIVGALLGDTVKAFPETAEAPAGYDRASFEEAMRTLLDQAWVRLDAGARSGRVVWPMPLRPDLWLHTWINLETERVRAAGKAVALVHTMDAQAGTAITEVTIAVGLPGDVPASLPTWALPETPDPDTAAAASLPVGAVSAVHHEFVGGLAGSPEFDEATMIGVCTNTNAWMDDATKAARNWYPNQLTIQAPEIDAADRDPLDLPVTMTYEADVPTDLLELL